MNQSIHNAYWLSRFESILNSALAQHRAVSLIRVDLRFPEYMPVTIMDPDPDSAVISRFFASLKAKIQAYQRHKRRANKRVHATSLRYFWCREFGKEKGRKHYHVILLLNKDTWCSPGDFTVPSSLATLIQLLPMIRLCLVDVLKPGRFQTKSLVKPLFSGSSVVMWKRCRKPGTEPVIS